MIEINIKIDDQQAEYLREIATRNNLKNGEWSGLHYLLLSAVSNREFIEFLRKKVAVPITVTDIFNQGFIDGYDFNDVYSEMKRVQGHILAALGQTWDEEMEI